VTKPSKGAAIFLFFFGLVFLVPGLIALFTFIANSAQNSTSSTIAAAAIALFISSIGAGLILLAVYGNRRLQEQAALEEANPSAPWLWRKDWGSRRAEGKRKSTFVTVWVICILCNMVVIPIAASLALKPADGNNSGVFVALGLALLGAILFLVAVRATLRHQRFGNPYFEFASLPFSPGGRVAGRIQLRLDSGAQQGVDLRLTCVRKLVTGSGDNRSTVETVLWQTGETVPSGALGMDSLGRTIPVDLALPVDAYVTDCDNPSDQVLWLLHAKANVPGISFSDDFEVPVFRTSSAPETLPALSSSENFGSAGTSLTRDAGEVLAPAHSKVIVSSEAGGTEFYFPALRTPSRALFLVLFTAIWTAVVYFLFHSSAPWLFPVVFGFFDLLLMLAVFHVVLGTARVLVGNGEIAATRRILGVGSTKRFSFSEIDAILPVTSGQGSNPTYAIRLRTKNGRSITLADEMTSRQEARWIVSQIESLAGLKIDTHVEVDSPYGPPPQPGQPLFNSWPTASVGAGSLEVSGQRSRPQSRTSTVMSLALFALCAAGMLAWQGWRFSTLKTRASAARAKARTNARPVPPAASIVPPRHVVTAAMTAGDAERVLALPAQEQAEELLERSIGHDQRALEFFEQCVESWIGHIRLTERMKQLEIRSEFSSDLRVRYLNADINLTLDGWQKNEQAAEMLIERARTDLHYRAAAVYFLGMLAGRGVAYERIHPVLLEYAKHDPDATVRQWAVEGMRYLGKDEALDELFESFAADPSNNVRERAGCNLSDCGNFSRAQRMRVVPRLIDLAADPSTNAPTRAWSYLALREITDANVPGDAKAWRNWYDQHGLEKLREFQQLDWWKVRGDE
jgi:HEAT repeats